MPKVPGESLQPCSMFYLPGQIVEIVEAFSAAIQKRTRVVGEPERRKYIERRFAGIPSEIGLGDQHRNIRGQSVVTPDLHDVADEFRFVVETAPGDTARLEGVMLE